MFENLIWLVPAVIVLAGLKWPRAGLLIFAVTLPFFGAPPGGPYLAPLDASVLAVVFTGLRAGGRHRSSLDVGVVAFGVVTVAAFFPLAYRPPSWSLGTLAGILAFLPDVENWTILYTWRAVADLILGLGLYMVAKRAFARGMADALGRALGVGLLIALGIGFLEIAGWVDLWSFRPIGRTYFDGRFHTVFFHSGWLAEFVVMALPLAVAGWLLRATKGRLMALSLVALGGGAILLSGQRGAWFTALLQVGLAALLLRRQWMAGRFWPKLAALGSTLAVMVVLVTGVSISQPEIGSALRHRLGEATSNLSNRTVVWEAALEMARERPMLGWGAGSFSPVLDLEVMARRPKEERVAGRAILGHHHAWLTAHSTYFMLLAECGLLGLASLLLLGLLLSQTLWHSIKSGEAHTRALAIALAVSTAGFVVYGLVQYMFFPRANGYLVWLLLGIAAALDAGTIRWRLEKAPRVIALVALVLLPFRALTGEPAPGRGDRSFGFHAPERGQQGEVYEWTAAERAVRRVSWEGEVLHLELANGHPKASARPVLVEVIVDGAIVEQVVVGAGWRDASAYLGPPTKEFIILELAVDHTFRPFSDYRRDPDLEDSRDLRRLGVVLGEISWEKAPKRNQLKVPYRE
jgi:O-antigen ligase